MEIIFVIVALIVIGALGLHLYKRMGQIRERRLKENEYNTAVVMWTFARDLKLQMDEVVREGTGLLSFSNIKIPHGPGYNLTLEINGFDFRLYGLPERLERSGRLSFYINKSMTLRAGERNGEKATEDDPEFVGDSETEAKES